MIRFKVNGFFYFKIGLCQCSARPPPAGSCARALSRKRKQPLHEQQWRRSSDDGVEGFSVQMGFRGHKQHTLPDQQVTDSPLTERLTSLTAASVALISSDIKASA